MSSVRLLFIVPSLIRAGAETQVISLVNGLAARGAQVHLAIFGDALDQLDRVDRARVRFHRLRRGGRLGLDLVVALARLLREHRFAAVHCTLQISLFYAWAASRLLARRRRPKLVLAVHTTLNRSPRDERFDRWLYRPLLRACARVVFVCEAQAAWWYARFPELRGRGEVVYNGIDADTFAPAPAGIGTAARETAARETAASGTAARGTPAAAAGDALRHRLRIDACAPIVLCVARLRPEKGHDLLLEAFAAVPSEARAHLLLAGDGEMRDAILARRERLGLAGRVHLLGDVADTRPLYAAALVSVLASTSVETFSMAMLESLAMETPMIASDIGGLREAIEPGTTGWLTPPGDVAALATALSDALADPRRTRALGRAGRVRVLASFTVATMVARTEALLTAVVGEPLAAAASAAADAPGSVR